MLLFPGIGLSPLWKEVRCVMAHCHGSYLNHKYPDPHLHTRILTFHCDLRLQQTEIKISSTLRQQQFSCNDGENASMLPRDVPPSV